MAVFMKSLEALAKEHGVSYTIAALVPFKETGKGGDEGNVGNSAMNLHESLSDKQKAHLLMALDRALEELAAGVSKKAQRLPLMMLAELLKDSSDD